MRRHRAVHVRAALALVSVLPTFAVERALAQACPNEACAPGYACETSVGQQCWSSCDADAGARDAGAFPSDPAVDGSAAAPGEKPIPDGGWWDPCWATPICEPVEYHYCTQARCTADADCPANMVCHTNSWQECSGGTEPCKPGLDCDAEGGTFSCTEHSESRCARRIDLPCQADADCGEGYECAENRWYGCSGGGGASIDADGGIVYEDAGYVCEWYTGGSYCKLLDIPCESDAECAADMRCQQHYEWPSCKVPDQGAIDVDGGPAECPPPVISTTCQPWYPSTQDAGAVIGGGYGGGADAGTPPSGGYGGGAIPGGSGGTIGSGSMAGGGGGVGGGGPAIDAGSSSSSDAGSAAGEEDDDEHGHQRGGLLRRLLHHIFGTGGCSVSGAAAHGNLSGFLLLGLALCSRRRRS